nr:sensor histidine kinase [Mucilaginibacter sp. L294]
MRNLSWLISLFLFSTNAFAQIPLATNGYLDSLNQQLNKSLPNAVKAKSSFLLSEFYIESDTAKASSYLQLGLKYSKGDKYMQAVALFYQGSLAAKAKKDYSLGEKLFLQADAELKTFNTKDALLIRSMSWHNYATIQQIKDNLKAYIDIILNKAIPLAIQANNRAYLGKNYYDVSFGFKNLGQFDKAEVYLKKATTTLKDANAPRYLAVAYQTIGENYGMQGKVKEAKMVLDSMKTILLPFPQSEIWLDYYAAEALRLTVSRQFDNSLAISEKGLIMARKLNLKYQENRLLLQKYYASINKKDFSASKDVLLDLAKHKEYMTYAANRLQLFSGLAMCYEGLKDIPKAFEWQKRYSQLSDSLNNSKLQETISTLDIKYKTAENEKKITALNAEKKQTLLTNWLLTGASIFLLALAGFIFFYYRNYKKLATQREINLQQKATDIEQKQQIELTKAMLDAEEKERNRVARDLHDGLGGMLADVKINLSSWAKHNNNNMETQDSDLQRIITQLDGSVNELRNIARNMMPQTLLHYGLETALKELCEMMMANDLEVDFQPINISKTIPLPQQIGIYRIAQEIVANILKHANATEIMLQCSQNQNRFYITAEDNGKGFDTTKPNLKGGLGLGNIKSRVGYLNGQFDISSTINGGTIINIELDVD